ncbi:hypothetical protein MKW94_025739, partial [Papaver nudicaule]|nr:hypothetical protein [Papaver nudicaule]
MVLKAHEHEKRAAKKWKSFSAKVILEIKRGKSSSKHKQVHNISESEDYCTIDYSDFDNPNYCLINCCSLNKSDFNDSNKIPKVEKPQAVKLPEIKESPKMKPDRISDVEMIKERFAKLLLGEDMSGGGKGVSSALALSNAITNLA